MPRIASKSTARHIIRFQLLDQFIGSCRSAHQLFLIDCYEHIGIPFKQFRLMRFQEKPVFLYLAICLSKHIFVNL